MDSLKSIRLVSVVVGVFIVVGCSGSVELGGKYMPQSDVEQTASRELAASVGIEETPDIKCPGDLAGEIGTKMTCELSVEGDDTTYPVYIQVTEVEGEDIGFTVKVGETPN